MTSLLMPCNGCGKNPGTHYPRLRFRGARGSDLAIVLVDLPVCESCTRDDDVRRRLMYSRTVVEWAAKKLRARCRTQIAPGRTRLNFIPIPEEDRCSTPPTSSEQP